MTSDTKGAVKHSKFSFSSHAIAGGVSAVFSATFTCPFEVAKTRQQSALYKNVITFSHNYPAPIKFIIKPFKETGSVMKDVYINDGTRGLFKGLGPNLIGIIPLRAIHFGVYGFSKQKLTHMNGGVEKPWIHMLSSFCAGFCSTTVTNPLWMVKTRIQLESKKYTATGEALPLKYKNAFQTAKTIYKEEGLKAFSKGLAASYVGLSETTIQFTTYEYFKKLVRQNKEKKALNKTAKKHSPKVQKFIEWADDFVCAAGAKFIASGITYPHEVLRTRMREVPVNGVSPYTGLVQAAKLIVKTEGVGALYRGLGTHLIRVVPNAAILFSVYEIVLYGHKKYFNKGEEKDGDDGHK